MTTLNELNLQYTNLGLSEALTRLRAQFDGRIVFSTSLGLEDQAITDAIFRNDLAIEVFTLDTGRNFPETYATLDETRRKYGKSITAYYPQTEAIQTYVNNNGINAMYDSLALRKECCHIRKIEPLKRALKGAQIWITGLRAAQSSYRAANMNLFEDDASFGLLKFNPILSWSGEKLWAYIHQYEVPYNALHEQGFPSIGCAPCTRAIAAGEDERAGRWWWEQNSGAQECGLHFKDGKPERRKVA
ncbi:MAG TPA: phosphoadenylyl-sulfate reductase [Thiolinea sp.]|nr:phosphoadenylyl-sulfate reductase [Thiolinea sp.]